MNKLLFKAKTSLLSSHIEVRKKGGKTLLVIEALEEHKAWGEKLFPGDDREYTVEKIPIEVEWEIQEEQLLQKVELINSLKAPFILFTYEGVLPRVLHDLEVIKKRKPEEFEKDWTLFPYNPKEERLRKLEEEEKWLSQLDWDEINGGW